VDADLPFRYLLLLGFQTFHYLPNGAKLALLPLRIDVVRPDLLPLLHAKAIQTTIDTVPHRLVEVEAATKTTIEGDTEAEIEEVEEEEDIVAEEEEDTVTLTPIPPTLAIETISLQQFLLRNSRPLRLRPKLKRQRSLCRRSLRRSRMLSS
jgi:hypothetical protein